MQAARIKRSINKLLAYIRSLDPRDPSTATVVILFFYVIIYTRALVAKAVVKPPQTKTEKKRAEKAKEGDNDDEGPVKKEDMVYKTLLANLFDKVILDEAHKLKNSNSQVLELVRLLRAPYM